MYSNKSQSQQIEELKQNLKELKEDEQIRAKEHEKEIIKLNDQIKTYQSLNQLKSNQLQELKDKIDKMEKQKETKINELQNKENELQNKENQLNLQIKNLKDEIFQKKTQFDKDLKQQQESSQKILKDQEQSLKQQIDKEKQEKQVIIAQTKQQNDILNNSINELKQLQIQLRQDFEKEQENLKKQHKTQLEDVISKLESKLNEKSQEMEKEKQQKNEQIDQLKDENQKQTIEIEKLTEDNSCKIEQISQLEEGSQENEKQKQQLNEQIQQLQNQNDQQSIEVEQLKKKINENQMQLEDLNQQNEEKQSQIDLLEKESTNLQQERDQLKNELNKQIKDNEQKVNEYQSKIQQLEKTVQDEQEKLISQSNSNKIQNEELKNLVEDLQKYKQQIDKLNRYVPPKDINGSGYDQVIQMESMLDIQKHQQMQQDPSSTSQIGQNMNQKVVSVKNINKNNIIEQQLIVVGFQGFRSQGKTFLLNCLINENFPSEHHINTAGICLKYQILKGRNIVYLDTEGLDGPVKIDYENNQNYKDYLINIGNGEQDEKNLQLIKQEVINKHQYQKVTQQLQQEFVISNSHIFIILVSNISQEDINLINSIQSYLKSDSCQKTILVVHNLKDYYSQESVDKYILKLKDLFPLRQQEVPTFEQPTYNYNSYFVDNMNTNINHVFMANQNSPAGQIYNKFALDYLKDIIHDYKRVQNVNIAEKFNSFLNQNIQRYLRIKVENSTQGSKKKEFFEYDKEQQIIQLKDNCKILQPKELQMDIFGYMQKQYSYSIVKSDKKLYLFVDIPGSVEITPKFDKYQGILDLIIVHKELVEQSQGETIVTTRKNDEVCLNLKISGKDQIHKMLKKEQKNLQNGVHQFVFEEENEVEYF